ncbi:hypothetical protein ACH4C6_34075 [Streptomyces sp. NPDC017943]|uniref:hypothetical protein n=1 Tax=Streptomyces sp. NPDC017943 TaxID=3365019 RepID=UPI0037B61A8F
MKATVIADWHGRTLWTDALRPGRMRDATAARNEGIAVCFRHFPDVEVFLDDGYLGLSRDHRGQAIPPDRGPEPWPAESSSGNGLATGTPPTASPSTPPPTTNAGSNSPAGPTAATACPTSTVPSSALSRPYCQRLRTGHDRAEHPLTCY